MTDPNAQPPVESDPVSQVEGSVFANKAAQNVTGIPAWDDILEMPPVIHVTGDYGAAGGKIKVYLSGPMSGYVGHNYPVFAKACERLRAMGLEVVSPAELGYQPGWNWLQYIIRDLESIQGCHGVVVLPRFYESAGALIEVMACRRMGMAIWKLDGSEFIGELRLDESLDYESDDLELIGSAPLPPAAAPLPPAAAPLPPAAAPLPPAAQEVASDREFVARMEREMGRTGRTILPFVQTLLDDLNESDNAWVAVACGDSSHVIMRSNPHGICTLTDEFIEDNAMNRDNLLRIIREACAS